MPIKAVGDWAAAALSKPKKGEAMLELKAGQILWCQNDKAVHRPGVGWVYGYPKKWGKVLSLDEGKVEVRFYNPSKSRHTYARSKIVAWLADNTLFPSRDALIAWLRG